MNLQRHISSKKRRQETPLEETVDEKNISDYFLLLALALVTIGTFMCLMSVFSGCGSPFSEPTEQEDRTISEV